MGNDDCSDSYLIKWYIKSNCNLQVVEHSIEIITFETKIKIFGINIATMQHETFSAL